MIRQEPTTTFNVTQILFNVAIVYRAFSTLVILFINVLFFNVPIQIRIENQILKTVSRLIGMLYKTILCH